MERENIKRMIKGLWMGDSVKGDDLLVEFDRLTKQRDAYREETEGLRVDKVALKSENEKIEESRQAYIEILDETMLENEELQSHLDKISEPIREWLSTIPPVSKSWDEHKMGYAFKAVGAIQEYLDSQKKPRPADSHRKPNHVHSDDSGIFWEGKEEDCPICNPKCEHKNRFRLNLTSRGGLHKTDQCQDCGEWLPAVSLTQCPECIWGQKIVYVNSYIVPVFVEGRWDKQDWVYGRCPRCHGQGVVPC